MAVLTETNPTPIQPLSPYLQTLKPQRQNLQYKGPDSSEGIGLCELLLKV